MPDDGRSRGSHATPFQPSDSAEPARLLALAAGLIDTLVNGRFGQQAERVQRIRPKLVDVVGARGLDISISPRVIGCSAKLRPAYSRRTTLRFSP
jgi:hypothetical protein